MESQSCCQEADGDSHVAFRNLDKLERFRNGSFVSQEGKAQCNCHVSNNHDCEKDVFIEWLLPGSTPIRQKAVPGDGYDHQDIDDCCRMVFRIESACLYGGNWLGVRLVLACVIEVEVSGEYATQRSDNIAPDIQMVVQTEHVVIWSVSGGAGILFRLEGGSRKR